MRRGEGGKEMLQTIKHQMDEEVEIKKKSELTHWKEDRWQAKLLTALCLIFRLLSDPKMMMK